METWLGLPADVKALLKKGYNRSVELNSTVLEQELKRPRNAYNDWAEGVHYGSLKSMPAFQLSVRLIEYMDVIDKEDHTDFEGHVTTILTSELHIFKTSCMTPLRDNPFLAHWVEYCHRIQHMLPYVDDKYIELLWRARHEVIKLALTSPGVESGLAERAVKNKEMRSPELIVATCGREQLEHIDLTPFVHMLWAQGVSLSPGLQSHFPAPSRQVVAAVKGPLDRSSTSSAMTLSDDEHCTVIENSEHTTKRADSGLTDLDVDFKLSPVQTTVSSEKGKEPVADFWPINARSSVDDVKKAIQVDPAQVEASLSRLPLELASLELLTRLLEGGILHDAPVDASAITREYVQHCLRIIEHLDVASSPSLETSTPWGDDNLTATDGIPRGRGEQMHAVRILVMFLKNLIRKGLLPIQELAFDLQEIRVRYIWIMEVREFVKFLEGGEMITSNDGDVVQHGVGG